MVGTSEMFLAERLTRRSQEIVYVFEQLHNQFSDLEANVKQGPASHHNSQDMAVQSNLMAGDITEMQEHFEKVSKRAQT